MSVLEAKHIRFFQTLANRTRLELVFALRETSKTVSALVEELGYHQSTISNNLKRLHDCGFVSKQKHGRERIYSLNTDTIEPLLNLIDEHTEHFCKPCPTNTEREQVTMHS